MTPKKITAATMGISKICILYSRPFHRLRPYRLRIEETIGAGAVVCLLYLQRLNPTSCRSTTSASARRSTPSFHSQVLDASESFSENMPHDFPIACFR